MTTRVMIMAGGTGGHVFPGLAVAEALQARGAEVVWLGTRRGLEATLVPEAGIDMEWLSIAGLRGKGVLGWLLAPLRMAVAMFQALVVIMRQRPMVIVGMGGFAAGPGGVMTWLLHKPLLIHEQNAVAGLTNRTLARLAGTVVEAFPGTFPAKRRAVSVGNPVRGTIAQLAPPAQRFADRQGPLRLLVLGGSQGALAINEMMPAALAGLPSQNRPQVWHQTGRSHEQVTRAAYDEYGVEARLAPFIDDMAEAYGWADLVVCRSGALTVAELAAAGVAAVLVPFPYAVDDHQTANGRYLADNGAAVLAQQRDLSAEALSELLAQFCDDCGAGRGRLLAMAEQARALALPDAAARVAELCLEASHG